MSVRSPQVFVAPSVVSAAEVVATMIDELLRAEPNPVLGLAAGATPAPVYRLLRSWRPPVAGLSVVLLDEYVGLDPAAATSFRHQICSQLTDVIGLDPCNVHTLDGHAEDLAAECGRFEQRIVELGGVDLQLLGLGRNGHVGFNEPGSAASSRTRMIELSELTRTDNAAAFGSPANVPRRALTQGIGTIMDARRLVLLATGPHKAPAVAAALEGPVGEAVPASLLRRHRDLTVVLDRIASCQLKSIERRSVEPVQDHRPRR